jgi:NRPS condensation-like uncharacterized protein
MDITADRIAELSLVKQALLELRLKQNGAGGALKHAITRRATRDELSLSFAQQRLWFLYQHDPDNPSRNQPKAIRLRGPLDVTSLQKVLDHLVARHEVLRTTFASGEPSPVQVIAESWAVEMPLIDLRAWSNSARDAEAQRLLTETIRRPFDLSHDLMLRALLLRLADQEHVLLLVTHHIASDVLSGNILWRKLATLYEAFIANRLHR